jgi:hypothetical protein
MDKVYRHPYKRHALEAAHESHLLQALKGAKMPATQSALSRISTRNADLKHTPPAADPPSNWTEPSGIPPEAESAESLLRALAQSLQAWRSQLPPHLQPGLLALVHGGAPIEVQSIALCAPDSIRLSGSCQGRAYKVLALASNIQFLCVPKTDTLNTTPTCVDFELGGEVFSA